MKIGLISPVQEPLGNSILYAGTERVVLYTAYGLRELGHDVILYAPGNSDGELKRDFRFRETVGTSLRQTPPLDKDVVARELYATVAAQRAYTLVQQDRPDVVINHMGFHLLPVWADRENCPPLMTVCHGYLGAAVDSLFFGDPLFRGHPLISISNDQRRHGPASLHFIETVYNPVPIPSNPRTGDEEGIVWPGKINFQYGEYLAWIGRFSPVKRPHLAIDIAMEAGMPIVLAGKREAFEARYWDTEIEPRMKHYGDRIVFLGEVDDHAKAHVYRGARAFLMPIDWHEPFGLVVAEALSYGTPVIATNMGSMPEIIKNGEVGYLIDQTSNEAEYIQNAVTRVKACATIDRTACTRCVQELFSPIMSARGYEVACVTYREKLRLQQARRMYHA